MLLPTVLESDVAEEAVAESGEAGASVGAPAAADGRPGAEAVVEGGSPRPPAPTSRLRRKIQELEQE
eukprot:11733719-Alexandrium_andersonii.AAC.1